MATVNINGVWLFNDTLILPSFFPASPGKYTETVNFTSNNEYFTSFIFSYDSNLPNYEYKRLEWRGDGTLALPYEWYGGGTYGANSYLGWLDNSGANSSVYKTIDFGKTEQPISMDFYNWLLVNAIPVSQPEEPEEEVKYSINRSSLTAIGDAIRAKTGEEGLLSLAEMVDAIGAIDGIPVALPSVEGGLF